MKYKNPLLIVSLSLAALIALVFTEANFMISPGKPIQAHVEIADDCFSCHTPFFGSTPEKCITCHRVEDIGLKTTEGIAIGGEKKNVAFHQKLVEDDCVACHSDHNGVMAFRPISRFSHELIAQSLYTQCEGCHANPEDSLHRKISGNCSQCHTIVGWKPATFRHEDYFRFDRHHRSDCETCHVNNDYNDYTCYGCHEHSRSKIRREHREEGIYEYENCVECHRSGDEDEAEKRWRSSDRDAYRSRRDLSRGEHEEHYRRHHDDDDDDDDD